MNQNTEFSEHLKYDVHKTEGEFTFKVDHIRQQIADLLGLRVETVIRVIKKFRKEKRGCNHQKKSL